MSVFSNRLKQLRLEKGENQSDIAAFLGVSVQSYSAYEGSREPKYDLLCKIANYFDVSTDYLLGISCAKKPETADVMRMTGLSENAIQRIMQLSSAGIGEIVSDLIFSVGFTKSLWQMDEMLKLNLKDNDHLIITKDELDKLNSGEKVTGHVVPAGTIRAIYEERAQHALGQAVDEALEKAEERNKE